MFVYGPPMVLIGSATEITIAIVTGLVGTMTLAAAAQGFLLRNATWVERGILLIAALFLIKPGLVTDLIGLGLLIMVAGFQYIKIRKK
jgi:TRAP-type uncharacterized transport system fused permease subunit